MSQFARGLVLETETEIPVIVAPDAASSGARLAFTTRSGGTSTGAFESLNLSEAVGDLKDAVAENRRRAAGAVGFALESLALIKQVHGRSVLAAGSGDAGVLGEADGLVTTDPGVVLGVLTADCVPVLLARQGAVAAVHAGWRGLVAGVVEGALDRLGGAERAWIGPSVRACHYEVGSEVIDRFRRRSLPVVDASHVDPPGAAAQILRRAGVTEIAMVNACTGCEASPFFSHRRDGLTGRQGAFIWLE